MKINLKVTTLLVLSSAIVLLSACGKQEVDGNVNFGRDTDNTEKLDNYKVQKDDVRGQVTSITDESVTIEVTEAGATNKDSMLGIGSEVTFHVLEEDLEWFRSSQVDGITEITFSVPVGTAATRSLPPQISSAKIVDIQVD